MINLLELIGILILAVAVISIAMTFLFPFVYVIGNWWMDKIADWLGD